VQLQLLMSQAREVQLLMEEEIESNNYESAALLQVEMEWIHERCNRMRPNVRTSAPHEDVARCASAKPEESLATPGGREGHAAVTWTVDSADTGATGVGAEARITERVNLQERINLLHHQLEAALGEEDFDLCDALNAEISALARQRNSLLDELS
jgi:hypothetical protein